jgi:hypothetical protein
MQAIYEFRLDVTRPFPAKVYTRAILENPAAPTSPFVYEHHLLPDEKSTWAIHGPVRRIELGSRYALVFEVYSDSARLELLERVEQPIQSSFDNSSGCIEPDKRVRPVLLYAKAPNGEPIPSEKLLWPCRTDRT